MTETRPSDVIAFNWHTWHASINGTDRHQWIISYAKEPRTTEETRRLRDFFGSAVPEGDQSNDGVGEHPNRFWRQTPRRYEAPGALI